MGLLNVDKIKGQFEYSLSNMQPRQRKQINETMQANQLSVQTNINTMYLQQELNFASPYATSVTSKSSKKPSLKPKSRNSAKISIDYGLTMHSSISNCKNLTRAKVPKKH